MRMDYEVEIRSVRDDCDAICVKFYFYFKILHKSQVSLKEMGPRLTIKRKGRKICFQRFVLSMSVGSMSH